MVRLVHDDVLKIILRKHREPFLLAKGLHRSYRHGKETAEAVTLALLKGGIESRDLLQLVDGLIEKFAAMRHDENPVTQIHLMFCHRGKHNRLSKTRAEDEERLATSLAPLGQDCLFRLGLIWSKLHFVSSHQNGMSSELIGIPPMPAESAAGKNFSS